MRGKWSYIVCLLAGAVAWSGAAAHAQTDVAASVDGAFGVPTHSGSSLSGTETQRAANAAGALLEVRHV